MITREFIDALNIVDLAQALEWTVNTNANNDNGANLTFASPAVIEQAQLHCWLVSPR